MIEYSLGEESMLKWYGGIAIVLALLLAIFFPSIAEIAKQVWAKYLIVNEVLKMYGI